MIFQDSQSSLNPTKTIGKQVAEPVRLHRGASRAQARDRAIEVLELVGLPQPLERLERLPASALRGPAPARDDRDRAGLRTARADRRRADHGARRDDPGADPRAARRPQGPPRHGDAAGHPRHGRRRRARRPDQRDVRRADRRDGADRGALCGDAPPLHPGAARLDPADDAGQHQGAGNDARPAARPHPPADRLPLRAALPPRERPVHRRGAAADRRGPRAPVRLLAPGRRAGLAAARHLRRRRAAARAHSHGTCSRSRTRCASTPSPRARCSSARSTR